MRILDQIVDILNTRLQTGTLASGYFQNSDYNGIAYLTNPTDDSPRNPYILDHGKAKDVIVNDRYDFSIYHRVLDVYFNPNNGYGDGDGMISMVCNMYAVVYADQIKTNNTAHDLALLVSSGLNYTLTQSDLGNSKILRVKASVLRANLNGSQVFTGEYGNGGHNPMQITSAMIGVTYQLEINAHSSCLDCPTC